MVRDWDERADELASDAIAAGEPTAWFDRLYGEGARDHVTMPWDRTAPNPALEAWVRTVGVSGDGRTAVVVGCGLGADAEFLASLGFAVTAFDVSETAVRLARERNPGTTVTYTQGDLLDLPPDWAQGFDVVVEIFTLQALPDPPRAQAIRGVRSLVAPGGKLFAVALRTDAAADATSGPPFALSEGTMRSLGGEAQDSDRLETVELAPVSGALWRAVFTAPTAPG